MRPIKASCVWCGANAVVFALPGSRCHSCSTKWRAILWADFKLEEIREFVQRIGTTIDVFFGAGTEARLFSPSRAWTLIPPDEVREMRKRVDQQIIMRFARDVTEDLSLEIDKSMLAGLDLSTKKILVRRKEK